MALLLLWISAFFTAAPACAGPTAGIGAVAQNMFKVTSSPSAARNPVGAAYLPELSLGWLVATNGARFYPSLGFTPIAKKSPDDGQKKSVLSLTAPLLLPFAGIELKGGPALQFYRISGSGGESIQNNGASTATFYLPSGSVTTRVFYLDLGAAMAGRSYRADLDFLFTGIFASRFSATGILRLSYVFP